jgi:hypothetical protein
MGFGGRIMNEQYFVQKKNFETGKSERIATGLTAEQAMEMSESLNAETTDNPYQFGVSLGGW